MSTRSVLWLLLVIVTNACRHASTSSPEGRGSRSIASRTSLNSGSSFRSPPTRPESASMMKGIPYSSEWVDASRGSHAVAAHHSLASFARAADFGHPDIWAWSKITLVLVAPDGQHVLVRSNGGVEVFDGGGQREASVERTGAIGSTVATAAGFFHDLQSYDWSGSPRDTSIDVLGVGAARVWATRLEEGAARIVYQEPRMGNHGQFQEPRMWLIAEHLAKGSLLKKAIGVDLLSSTRGMGAIAGDGRAVLLTLAPAMHVYSPDVVKDYDLGKLADVPLAFVPYDVSIVGESVAAIEAIGVPARDETEKDLGPYQLFFDVFTRLPQFRTRFTTRLHLLSFAGVEEAKVTVPFEVAEPPVDGGGGLVYLVGMGLAAVRGGHVLWSHASPKLMLATAFAGGELALAVGSELQIVAPDGTVKQSFSTGGDPIAAPPAIGPDGAVWVATAKALYVAR